MSIKIKKKSSILRSFYLFILGFLGFSVLGQQLLLDVLHFPISLMEIYFIPAIWFERKNIKQAIKRFMFVNFQRAMLYFLLITGVIFGIIITFDLKMLLSYRSIIYLALCYFYTSRRGDFRCKIEDVLLVSMSAVAGELICVSFISTAAIHSSTNCIAIAMAIISAFILEKYIVACVAVAMSMFLAINTGFRIGIFVVLLCVLEMIIYTIFRKDRTVKANKLFSRIGILVGVILAVFLFTNYYEIIIGKVAEITGMSSFAVFRITERMKGLLQLDFRASQDVERLNVYRYAITRISQIIPRGLIGESIGEYWLYIDAPLIYLYDIFGSVGCWGIVVWFLGLFVKNIKCIRMYDGNALKKLTVLISPLFIFLAIVNNSFLVIMFQAIETGLLLGILKNKNLMFNNE